MGMNTDTSRPNRLLAALSLALAATIWLPSLHWLYRPKGSHLRAIGGVTVPATPLAPGQG